MHRFLLPLIALSTLGAWGCGTSNSGSSGGPVEDAGAPGDGGGPDGAQMGADGGGTEKDGGSTGKDGGLLTPGKFTYRDTDLRQGFTQGLLVVHQQTEGTTEYRASFADAAGIALSPIATFPASPPQVSIPELAIPVGATHVRLDAAVQGTWTFVGLALADNFPLIQDFGLGDGRDMLDVQAAAVFPGVGLRVMGHDASGKPGLRRCAEDGTMCSHVDLPLPSYTDTPEDTRHNTVNGARALLLSPVDQKLAFLFFNRAKQQAWLARCTNDGSSCTETLLQSNVLFFNQGLWQDPANGDIFFRGYGIPERMVRCAYDGTACTTFPKDSYGGAVSAAKKRLFWSKAGASLTLVTQRTDTGAKTTITVPTTMSADTFVLDEGGERLIVVSGGKKVICDFALTNCTVGTVAGATSSPEGFVRIPSTGHFFGANGSSLIDCDPDFSACTSAALPNGDTVDSSLVLPPTSSGGVVVLSARAPLVAADVQQLTTCNSTGQGCAAAQLDIVARRRGFAAVNGPAATIDTQSGVVYVARATPPARGVQAVVRCAADSADCSSLAPMPANSAQALFIDPARSQLIIAGESTQFCPLGGMGCSTKSRSGNGWDAYDAKGGRLLYTRRDELLAMGVPDGMTVSHGTQNGIADYGFAVMPSSGGVAFLRASELLRCGPDAAGCTTTPATTTLTPASNIYVSILKRSQNLGFSEKHQALILSGFRKDVATPQRLLVACSPTGCVDRAVPFSYDTGAAYDAETDSVYLLHVENNKLALQRCLPDASACSSVALPSIELGAYSMNIKAERGHVLITGHDRTRDQRPTLIRFRAW
jgi:hypothetical protein